VWIYYFSRVLLFAASWAAAADEVGGMTATGQAVPERTN